jgi:hypothetical protein
MIHGLDPIVTVFEAACYAWEVFECRLALITKGSPLEAVVTVNGVTMEHSSSWQYPVASGNYNWDFY